ncbi:MULTISPECIES: TetR/AcrR family transcriptional regulator [unclassified Clostridium]|uniref:TetR/AcrR family transcriptional regulator n=1 Tax=unclassified Clostridium TaxID=2614128 RepID=UPI0013F0958D|nr:MULTISPECIES: TetR/AcrR family transcriptional regulator [unclassified Clostridium]NFG61200.1 TetR/AcrR family transcriptional regulator [Clostridium botulinum]NFQ08946.1 TetR/AcrR family transcriptional regulator [Clostridium botulinum]
MAKQIEGVYEKVLECAKVEFLEKGFKDASLRTIAQNAKTSTGSIYTRFSDKKGLFNAIVVPVVEYLKQWFWLSQENFHKLPNDIQKEEVFNYSKDKIEDFVDYIYDNFDIFTLLISCSEGTGYSMFVHDLVEIEMEYTIKFIKAIGSDALSSERITPELMHMLSSSFYTGIFEIVVHKMTRESAHKYVNQLKRFFEVGWKDIFK